MLAKVWKKVLFAICIIACLYNIMHKLVSRISLETQLKSVQNQGSIIEMIDTSDKKQVVDNSSVVEENVNKVINENTERNANQNSIVVIY